MSSTETPKPRGKPSGSSRLRVQSPAGRLSARPPDLPETPQVKTEADVGLYYVQFVDRDPVKRCRGQKFRR